jgi:hypothetical protein
MRSQDLNCEILYRNLLGFQFYAGLSAVAVIAAVLLLT